MFNIVVISSFNFIVCLIHDLAESIVGDITPHCNVSDEDKVISIIICEVIVNFFVCSTLVKRLIL